MLAHTLVVLVAGATAGCSGDTEPQRATYVDGPARLCYEDAGFARPPCGPGARIGVYYAYGLRTHCGIEYAYFDDRHWVTEPPLNDGSGNPPAGWDNPWQSGWMRLRSEDEAEFTAADLKADFEPAPASFELPGCA